MKLVAKEPAGQRELSDPRVQQAIRSQLHDRREQLLKAAYYEVLRDTAKVENYYAKKVLDSNGIENSDDKVAALVQTSRRVSAEGRGFKPRDVVQMNLGFSREFAITPRSPAHLPHSPPRPRPPESSESSPSSAT